MYKNHNILINNVIEMRTANFTSTLSTTEKATFWCNYMDGLKGSLYAKEEPIRPNPESVWSRVSSSNITLSDVLYGKLEI